MPTNVLKIISYAEIFAQKKAKLFELTLNICIPRFSPKIKIIYHLAKFHSEKSGGAHCLQYYY
jgi:hypothetical protein